MRRALTTGFASLIAVALIAPAAQAATQIRHIQADMSGPQTIPPTPAGAATLDFVFKNKRGNRKTFTPRQLIRIDFSKVPMGCYNAPVNPTGTSQYLLTTTLETKIKLKKKAPLNPAKAKPGRYHFNFASEITGNFPAFTGTIGGSVDKPNGPATPRHPRSTGTLRIDDLDSPPDHWNCSAQGTWAGPIPPTAT